MSVYESSITNPKKQLEFYKVLSEQLQQENQQLKDKINTYENPEDLTLMFMYCDEKAKDKIKELQEIEKEHQKINGELREENEKLHQENQMLKLIVEKLTKKPYEYSVRGNL